MENLAIQLAEKEIPPETKRKKSKDSNSGRQRKKSDKIPKSATAKLENDENHTAKDTKEQKDCIVCLHNNKKNKKKIRTSCKIKCVQCNLYVHIKCWNEHKNV